VPSVTLEATKPRWLSRYSRQYPSFGGVVADWMEAALVHGEGELFGEPYRLDAWMRTALLYLYRFDPSTYKRVTRRAVFGVGKGNAKTEFAAAIALAEAVGPVVPWAGLEDGEWPLERKSPNVPIGAASRDQAGLCYGAAKAMVAHGELAPQFDLFDLEMRLKGRPGRVYRIAAEAGTNDGTLPTAFVADELHEWTGRKERVHIVVGNSLSKRSDGLEVNISTAGDPDQSGLLFNLYEYGKRCAAEAVDDSFLFMWWEPSNPEVDITNPDKLRGALAEANPSSWRDLEVIAKRWEIDRIPEAEFRRYHLNQWVTRGESWLPAGVWDGLANPARRVVDGERVVVGFDGSYNQDSTALVGCSLDGHLFEVATWERPPHVAEWRVDRDAVDAAVEKVFRRFDVVELVCDPARWSLYINEWVDRYGDRVVEYPNVRARMIPATAKLYDAAVNGLVSHDGSVVLAGHVANATVKEVPNGYVLRKDHPNRKIDAAIAAVMAYDRATQRVAEPGETSIWF